ncbi:lycopene cyclase family protein [Nocardia sp. NBC_00416]|uniref:lycopene cyclase family protein n=1 Tax=Nocardia sp. NBC_00416 TaxID=2975991 RepID=UPI002E1DF8CE
MTVDIAICGLGPAGRALAYRCLALGMTVTAVDPNPRRRWRATYAAWSDELPAWLDPAAVAATVAEPRAHGLRDHRIARSYSVLDTSRLQYSLDLAGATLVPDRAVSLDRHTVTLADGRTLRAGRVIDARGLRRRAGRPEQTAYGLLLPRSAHPEPSLFMDWRPDNGADPRATPSFLYAIPLNDDTVLLEETCLVGAPALEPDELARRLTHRLRARGIGSRGDEPVERVRFPVAGGVPGAARFGAAGGYLHPATGYSVAASLSAADAVAAGRSGWSPAARAVHRLRCAGSRALLALPPGDIPRFFDAFFDLDIELQRAYLSRRDDPIGTLTAMSRIFFAVPGALRARLTAATLGVGSLSHRPSGSVIME